jgi:hypothetical protein
MDSNDSKDPADTGDAGVLTSPAHERSGTTVDEAVATAEDGSQVEGVHTPSGQAESGESRVEQMPNVQGVTGPRVDGTHGDEPPPEPGPSPDEVGSGGAQRIVGARISDRVAAGQEVPDGPPFDSTGEGAE